MNRVLALLAVAMLAIPLPVANGANDEAEGCAPEVLLLPGLDGHESSAIYAMNDAGWAVGESGEIEPENGSLVEKTAVLWRDGDAVDLGIGGGVRPDGVVQSWAIDVNRQGLVAAARAGFDEDFAIVAWSSWLWRDGVKARLEGVGLRKHAFVADLNDRGVAVGSLGRLPWLDSSIRPVVWRDGMATLLPLPPGSKSAWAQFINNHGLVVGYRKPRGSPLQPWYWRLNDENGRLRTPAGDYVSITDVDNRDRILGRTSDKGKLLGEVRNQRAVLWRGPNSHPEVFGGLSLARSYDLNDHGDLTGYSGVRGGERAWVSRLGADSVVTLPSPPVQGKWLEILGASVIRGVTAFAPQGGVSVGGYAYKSGVLQAVIWTCTQTYD
jgi:hypothetical protein